MNVPCSPNPCPQPTGACCVRNPAGGADAVIVKPALAYLDIIKAVASETDLPVAAYNVSGEYAMVKAAGKLGLINEYAVMCETAVAAFRAGASAPRSRAPRA